MSKGFVIDNIYSVKNGYHFDKKVTFYEDDSTVVEAEYYYLNGYCNYIISWGFTKDSLGELRKSQAKKSKKAFFSFKRGWFDEN